MTIEWKNPCCFSSSSPPSSFSLCYIPFFDRSQRAVSTSPLTTRPRPTGLPNRLCPKKRLAAPASTSPTASLHTRTIRLIILTALTALTTPHTLPTRFNPHAPQIPPTSSLPTLNTPTRTGTTSTVRSSVHRIPLRAPAQPPTRRQTLRPTPANRLNVNDLTVAGRKARLYTRRLSLRRHRNRSIILPHTRRTPAPPTAVTAIANPHPRPQRRLASRTARRTSATSVGLHQLRSGRDPTGDRRAIARTLQHRDQVVGDTAATLRPEVITRTHLHWFLRVRCLTHTHSRQILGIL